MINSVSNSGIQNGHMATVLSIAPMCSYPPMDGASTRIISVASAISDAGYIVTVIGSNFILTITPGQVPVVTRFTVHGWRSKRKAAILAICTAGHYPEIKFHNPEWQRVVHDYINVNHPKVLITSYLWTMDIVQNLPFQPELIIYDTHNSEWQMYNTCILESHNPIHKWIWRNAIARYDALAHALPSGTVLMHISDADLMDHKTRRPDLRHILVPLCAGLAVSRTYQPDYTIMPKQLLFCGSLSGKMSVDALTYFANNFWPTIQSVSQVTIAGSNPSKQVQRMCQQYAWQLEANFDIHRKTELYNEAHFAILPFKHGSGSKLKLIEACSYGVPVLTTTGGNSGGLHLPSSATVSDNAIDWYCAIQSIAPRTEWLAETEMFCEEYAPVRTIGQLLTMLSTHNMVHNL